MKKLKFPNKEGVIELDDKSAGGSYACSVLLNNGAVEAKAQKKPKKSQQSQEKIVTYYTKGLFMHSQVL